MAACTRGLTGARKAYIVEEPLPEVSGGISASTAEERISFDPWDYPPTRMEILRDSYGGNSRQSDAGNQRSQSQMRSHVDHPAPGIKRSPRFDAPSTLPNYQELRLNTKCRPRSLPIHVGGIASVASVVLVVTCRAYADRRTSER